MVNIKIHLSYDWRSLLDSFLNSVIFLVIGYLMTIISPTVSALVFAVTAFLSIGIMPIAFLSTIISLLVILLSKDDSLAKKIASLVVPTASFLIGFEIGGLVSLILIGGSALH